MSNPTFKHSSSRTIRMANGDKIYRELRSYRQFLADECGWCSLPLEGTAHVDHDHVCCNRPDGKACAGCVRGAVHLKCNQEIARVDMLRAAGFVVQCPTARQELYFGKRPLLATFTNARTSYEPPEYSTCSICGGQVRADSAYGICRRSVECNRANSRLAQHAKRERDREGLNIFGADNTSAR